MKKKALSFSIAALSTLLISCGTVDASSTPSLSEPSQGVSYPYSPWGEEVGHVIYDCFQYDLPYIAADDVEVLSSIDPFGDPYLWLYLTFDGADNDTSIITQKLSDYATTCVKKGYTVTYETASYMDENYVVYQYDVYYADISINETTGLELQFLEGAKGGHELMGIYAMTYPLYDENSWPSNVVTKALGHDIPHPEIEGARYYASLGQFEDDNSIYAYVYTYGMYEEDLDAYIELLKTQGYSIRQGTDDYDLPYYAAFNGKTKTGLYIGFDYDNYTGSYIYAYEYEPFSPGGTSTSGISLL